MKQAIAEAEALFAHPLKQYALLKKFEDLIEKHEIDGVPDAFGENHHARAYFGIFKLILENNDFLSVDDTTRSAVTQYVELAMQIDRAVRTAVAEHSLNPQNVETAIRKALLPTLFAVMGLEKTNAVLEQVIQITRIGLARGNF